MSKAKDNLDTVGTFLTGKEGRDAVHIAMFPAESVCDSRLLPGQKVGLAQYGAPGQVSDLTEGREYLGVVDPFLTEPVARGDRFWVFLKPLTITGLRHSWSHPAFPDEKLPGAAG